MPGWLVAVIVTWGIAGGCYLLWYSDRPSKSTTEKLEHPDTSASRTSTFHRTVFTHPGMCNRDVGNEHSPLRVCHVTMRTNSPMRGPEVKNLCEITNLSLGTSQWHENRIPMADCMEWAAEHPDELYSDPT